MSKMGYLSSLTSFWRRLAVLIGLAGFIAMVFLGAGEWYMRAMNGR